MILLYSSKKTQYLMLFKQFLNFSSNSNGASVYTMLLIFADLSNFVLHFTTILQCPKKRCISAPLFSVNTIERWISQ